MRYKRRKAKRDKKLAEKRKLYDDFDKVFTFRNLWLSAHRCFKGVGWKTAPQKVRNAPISTIAALYKKLHAGKYKSRGFYCFTRIERGKERHIKSVHITERIVQSCFCQFSLVPMLTGSLIYDNGACIKGKGIDFAKDRMARHLHEYYRKTGSNKGWALVTDFHSYFDLIDHAKVEEIILLYYTDGRLIALYMHFVHNFGVRGLGLGSEISQITALRYPAEIDMLMTNAPDIEHYKRYMDDGNAISERSERLKECLTLFAAKCADYKIELNEKKTQIVKLSRGIPFLKLRYVLTSTGKVLRLPVKDSEKQMRKRLKKFAAKVERGEMTEEDCILSYGSWKSHYRHANAHYRLRRTDRLFTRLILKNKNKEVNKMAVVEETPYTDENGIQHDDLVRHYSDDGKNLVQVQTGKIYAEAIDKTPCKYTYIEEPDVEEASAQTTETTETPEVEAETEESSESKEGGYES